MVWKKYNKYLDEKNVKILWHLQKGKKMSLEEKIDELEKIIKLERGKVDIGATLKELAIRCERGWCIF